VSRSRPKYLTWSNDGKFIYIEIKSGRSRWSMRRSCAPTARARLRIESIVCYSIDWLNSSVNATIFSERPARCPSTAKLTKASSQQRSQLSAMCVECTLVSDRHAAHRDGNLRDPPVRVHRAHRS